MILKYGKHAGKQSEQVVLSDPAWLKWMMANQPDNFATKVCKGHIEVLDSKQFVETCHECGKLAQLASVYRDTSGPFMLWCSECNPYGAGAVEGTLTVIQTFDHAMRHVELRCNGRQADQKSIVRRLCEAKGLKKKPKAEEVVEFFKP